MKTKLLISDLNGVITNQPHLVSDLLRQVIPGDIEYLREQYDLYKVSEIKQEEFWERVDVSTPVEIEKKLLSLITLRDGFSEIFGHIKEFSHTAILSNMPTEWGNALLKRFNIAEYFDEIFLSGIHKLKKPERPIYEKLLRKFPNINSVNIYYVDDELGDLKTAKEFGIKTIWMRIGSPDANYKPDYQITTLSEILKIIS